MPSVSHVGNASSRRYERRRPEKTPLYKIVAERLEGWLEDRAVAEQPVSAHVERELWSYLTCGILCFGFRRARCTSCGQGYVVAFSCKGRGVCPSCNGRHMAQTATHLADHVIPPVPVLALLDRDVPSYFRSLERLLRYCARPPFALERLSVRRGGDGRIARVRYVLPRHWFTIWAANWVGPGAGGSPRARGPMASSNLPYLSSSTGSLTSCRRRASTGIACRLETSQAPLHPITSSGPPSRHSRSGTSASGKRPRRAGIRTTGALQEAAATRLTRPKSPAPTIRRGLHGQS